MIQELIAENLDLKNSTSTSSNNAIDKAHIAAGLILDNFESNGDSMDHLKLPITPMGSGTTPNGAQTENLIAQLQAKIWSLESENTMLT